MKNINLAALKLAFQLRDALIEIMAPIEATIGCSCWDLKKEWGTYEDAVSSLGGGDICFTGNEADAPNIQVCPENPSSISISKKIRGGKIEATLEEGGSGVQAGVIFRMPDDQIWDLALVEQEDHGAQDLSVMVWGDPLNEDYTQKTQIKYEDMAFCVLNDLFHTLMGEYGLNSCPLPSERIEAMARDFRKGEKDFEPYVRGQLEKLYHHNLCSNMAEWMCNLEKDESKWVPEDSSVEDYVSWVMDRVCTEDKTRREWWADFGFVPDDLDQIAEKYSLVWTDVFNAERQTYLVQSISSDGESFSRLMNQGQLCDYINMADCHGESYDIWDVTIPSKVRHCRFAGYQGALIEVVRDDDGKVVVSLYGEDH